MTGDARFEDGREAPLNLGALEPGDLPVISALCQDAVFVGADMVWQARARRFALLINRFRWEDRGRDRHGPERVRAMLVIDQVERVASQGVARGDADTVLSILSLDWQPGDAPGGVLELVLAGDGGIRLSVEALEVTLRDVTRPYAAPSGRTPAHED